MHSSCHERSTALYTEMHKALERHGMATRSAQVDAKLEVEVEGEEKAEVKGRGMER